MQPKRKNTDQKNLMIIGGVVVAAIVVAIAFILFSSQSSYTSGVVDYSQIPQSRTEDGGFVLGNPDAPVTIVAFEDFLCPHCQAYEPTIEQFISKYVVPGYAKFEYRFLPAVDPTYSPLAARFAECADILKPGSFWNAHDLLFSLASSARFNNSTPRTFAERIDISYTDLLDCSADATQVDKDGQLADQLGVTGTPTVFFRIGDAMPQISQFGQQPNLEQLGIIVQSMQ